MSYTYNTRNRRAGYTFVELLIVVLVMGILAAAAAPRFTAALDNTRVNGVARRIAADLNRLRAQAMITSSSTKPSVSFDTAADGYSFNGLADLDHTDRNYRVFLASTSHPVDLVAAEFVTSDNDVQTTLKYDLYGRPWCGSSDEQPLAKGTIRVTSGDLTRSVNIDPVTGTASVAD